MRSFFRSSRFKGFLGVFGVLLLGIVFAALTENSTSPASTVLGTVFSPLQRVSAGIADSMQDFSVYFRSAKTMSDKVSELESELADSRAQLVDSKRQRKSLFFTRNSLT